MRQQSPLELVVRGLQSVKANLKPVFSLQPSLIKFDRSALSEAGSRTSRGSPSSSSIAPSDGSDASLNSSIDVEEDFHALSTVHSYHISPPHAIHSGLDKNNVLGLGILNTPTTPDQPQIQHTHQSSQRNESLASLVDSRAADARERISDTGEKKQKKKTSPRVENVKRLIRAYDRGHRLNGRDLATRTLYLNEYRQLLDEIRNDAELYDYTADNRDKNNKRKKQLAVRMPTSFHEYLAERINRAVIVQQELVLTGKAECGTGECLGPYCKDSHTKDIAQKLQLQGHHTIKSSAEAESDKKDPDLSYKFDYPRSKFPGLVVEVGWSQKSSDLHKKCKWYIEKSRGEIRTVIGVDLFDLYECYPKRKTKPERPGDDEEDKATEADKEKMAEATVKKKALGKIFVWRANIDGDTGEVTAVPDEPKVFRDENGLPFGEVALRLSLEDFVSERIMGKIGHSHKPEFLLMSADLCYHFDRAVNDQIPWDREEEAKKDEQERKNRESKEKSGNEKKEARPRRSPGSPKVLAEWLRSGKKRIHDSIVRK
ncbi:hypothetical protein F5Y01DRAFT_323007 [Xylaria sp. FL0043]|nr:hypothetical protein F5Y01DRAFT_323007 [Xylaria sp. FL0043]